MEKEIIDGIRNNDTEQIKKFYRKQYSILSRWVIKNSGLKEDVDDIIQEGFLILIRKLKDENFKLECALSTYMFSICKHLWFQELRYRSKMLASDFECFNDLADDPSLKQLEDKKLSIYLNHLTKLEPKCRDLFLLCCQKKSLFEIMEILGFKNEQAVSDKKKNCRRKLIVNLLNCKDFKAIQSELSIDY